jgi:hypothetical protein
MRLKIRTVAVCLILAFFALVVVGVAANMGGCAALKPAAQKVEQNKETICAGGCLALDAAQCLTNIPFASCLEQCLGASIKLDPQCIQDAKGCAAMIDCFALKPSMPQSCVASVPSSDAGANPD